MNEEESDWPFDLNLLYSLSLNEKSHIKLVKIDVSPQGFPIFNAFLQFNNF